MEGYHRSVLLREAIAALEVKVGGWYLDCTLGDGGHAIEIIERGGRVIGIDVDPEALERAKERLWRLGLLGNTVLVQGNFRDLNNLISSLARIHLKGYTLGAKSSLAGAIFDLGVSKYQLETPERGFSFGKKGPLDMRMDPSLQVRALDLANTLTRKELYELFSSLGEEKYSWRLADAVVSTREVASFTTTTQLAEVIVRTVGGVKRARERIHPATRIFQALRMAVNDELDALQEGLNQVKDLIEKNGRIVVISFHSLEDRIVKNTFKQWESAGFGVILTKKPIMPTYGEIAENSRSRSAKMRVFRRF